MKVQAWMLRLAAAMVATAALAGCDRVRRQGAPPDLFACEEARSFRARIDSADEVWVTLPTHGFRMTRVEPEPRVEVTDEGEVREVERSPDDGPREYRAGANRLTLGDDSATLRLSNGTAYRGCRRADR